MDGQRLMAVNNETTRGSYPSRRKLGITPPKKQTKPLKLLAKGKVNIAG